MKQEKLIEIKNLKTYFYTEEGVAKAVDGVSFDIYKGEVLGIVGESGSGKSVTSLSINRLIPDPPGKIVDGEIIYNDVGTQATVLLQGQADCRILVKGTATPEGTFINDEGMVSKKYAVVQDSYYYQWFSYVISSHLQQVQYENFINDIVHPAGFKQFSDVMVNTSSSSNFRVAEPVLSGSDAYGRIFPTAKLQVEQSDATLRRENVNLPITLEHH